MSEQMRTFDNAWIDPDAMVAVVPMQPEPTTHGRCTLSLWRSRDAASDRRAPTSPPTSAGRDA